MESKVLIETAYKDKLSNRLAYPIGAEPISVAFEKLIKEKRISLSFNSEPFICKSGFQKILKDGDPHTVFQVSYRNIDPGYTASNYDIERGFYTETWGLIVFPVLKEQKKKVGDLLLEKGLKKAIDWISKNRPDTWKRGRHYFHIKYNPPNNELIFEFK